MWPWHLKIPFYPHRSRWEKPWQTYTPTPQLMALTMNASLRHSQHIINTRSFTKIGCINTGLLTELNCSNDQPPLIHSTYLLQNVKFSWTRKTASGSTIKFHAEKQPCLKPCDDAFWRFQRRKLHRRGIYSQVYLKTSTTKIKSGETRGTTFY